MFGKSKKNKNLGPFSTPQVQVVIASNNPSDKLKGTPDDRRVDPVNPGTAAPAPAAPISQSASAYRTEKKDDEPSILDMPNALESYNNQTEASEIPSLGGAPAPAAPEIPSLGAAPAPAPEIPSMPQAQAAPAAPAPATPQASQVCPVCGAPLTVRTATNGPMAGQKLAVCTNYPNCKFMTRIG